MVFGRSAGAGPYEQWTHQLRQWARDPSTKLEGLPPLTEDTFDQDTYLRLYSHVNDAIAGFMVMWKGELSRAFERAHSTHALGVELVRLRQLMSARLVLAKHSGWPEAIRAALTSSLRADLANIQSDLEDVAGRSSSRGSLDRKHTDELVALIRRNSLTTLMPPDVPDLPQPGATVAGTTGASTGRVARRILF